MKKRDLKEQIRRTDGSTKHPTPARYECRKVNSNGKVVMNRTGKNPRSKDNPPSDP